MTRLPAAVLWDMDGTLVDTEPYWINTEYALVESYGNTWSDEHAHALVGSDLLDSGAYIAEHGKVPLEPHEIVDRLLDGVVAQVEERVPWRRGARRLLAELNAAGVPCALVTMSWRRFVDPIVAQLPPGSFQTIVTGEDVTRGKPHPEPYLLAAAQLGVDATDCIAIEDSDTGMRSAIGAGLPRDRGAERGRRSTSSTGRRSSESLDELDLAVLSAVMQVPTAELSDVATTVDEPATDRPERRHGRDDDPPAPRAACCWARSRSPRSVSSRPGSRSTASPPTTAHLRHPHLSTRGRRTGRSRRR